MLTWVPPWLQGTIPAVALGSRMENGSTGKGKEAQPHAMMLWKFGFALGSGAAQVRKELGQSTKLSSSTFPSYLVTNFDIERNSQQLGCCRARL
mgnify:CR=1 FL=1